MKNDEKSIICYKFFETFSKRGTKQYKLKEGAPDCLQKFIMDLHIKEFHALPNDWIYDQVHTAFLQYDEYEDKEAFIYESEAEPYYSPLKKWVTEPFSDNFLDEALSENRFDAFYELIGCAQVKAIQLIRLRVCEFIDEVTAEELQ